MFLDHEVKRKALPELWENKNTDWETRRKEIIDVLQSELFGYMPPNP